ncbi:MAG: hypothetical protein KC777_03205 [Cyanobacteria bacterium HKST-UBA02]|nr:hypothetical protein [Cyanobacteria bacterium HKST-UBA02]
MKSSERPTKKTTSKRLIAAAAGALILALTAGTGYLWWTTTPQFALTQIRDSIKSRDPKTFNQFVDVAQVVTCFTDEVIFSPAERTRNLTRFQRAVGLGAFRIAKVSIDNALIFQIQKWISEKPVDPSSIELESEQPGSPDQAEVPENAPISSILRDELKLEKERLKERTYRKMVEYAATQPDTLVHRIFVAPEGGHRNTVRKIFRDYGFQKKNLKKVDLNMVGEKCLCTLHFDCPVSGRLVPVTFELLRDNTSPLSRFRVTRLIRANETFAAAGEDADQQVQGLVAHGLAGVTFSGVLKETKSIFMRVTDRAANALEDR